MTVTIQDEDEKQVEGLLVLIADTAYLKTDRGFYELNDDDLYQKAREYIEPSQVMDAVFIVQRVKSTEIEGGEQPHQVRSSDYAVPMMTLHWGRSTFWATKQVCASLVAQEVEREFR